MIKKPDFEVGGYKASAFYVLWALETYSSKDNTLKQQDIVDYLAEEGYKTDIKTVRSDLDLLQEIGYDIQGNGVQYDDYGNIIPTPRGKIYLKKDISDEKLQILIDTVLFSNYIGKAEAQELIDYLISLGSGDLKKKSAAARINGEQVYHQDNASFFDELKEIRKAMNPPKHETKKRISFKYAQYKCKGQEIVLESEREHIVSPYFFVSKKGNYYLIGYNHKQDCLWHYRLDYVKNVKILKDVIKVQEETELKGKSIGEYVSSHPYMFSGEIESVEVKIPSNRFGIIVDSFGSAYKIVSKDEDFIIAKIYCSLLDAFHWAMQFGTFIEVLGPQKLRNTIRTHVEGMALRYADSEGDRYDIAMLNANRKHSSYLDLSGINLSRRTKHHDIKGVRVLRLGDNNLSDVSFIGNYKRLFHLTIKNNPVKELSVIGELEWLKDLYLHNLPNVKNVDFLSKLTRLRCLTLNLDPTTDFTALNNYKGLTELNISRTCAYNSNIDFDKIEANNPNVKIDVYEPNSYAVMESSERNERAFLSCNTYPINVLSKIVNRYLLKDVSDEELQTALEESLKKLSAQERDIVIMYHKDKKSIAQIASILKITIDEVTRLKESAFKKLSHPSYQKSLEKFIKK